MLTEGVSTQIMFEECNPPTRRLDATDAGPEGMRHMGWRPVDRCAWWELRVVPLLSIEAPGSVLENFGWESVTLIHFRLSHAKDFGRLRLN